jgi:uncharacterized protein
MTRAAGTVPFREFVFKIHQRCNLSCDYCYVYTMGDETWKRLPASMTPEVWRAAAVRIRDHAEAHTLSQVRIVLHGGEPLLAGADRIVRLVSEVRGIVGGGATFVLQTNGILLDAATLDALVAAGVRVGVSLDGTPGQNDRHRVRADGRGSTGDVHRGLELLAGPYREAFAGILCTVDPRTDPVACYEALVAYRPPTVDLLLPHANWSRPPVRPDGGSVTPYGDWLVAVFDRWYDASPQETTVHLFADVIAPMLGGASRSEQVGLSPVAVAVIESDGAIEQVDALRSAYPGAGATGLDVHAHPLDAALDHPGVQARQAGIAGLADVCQRCRLVAICGGGHYAHRYREDNGFINPSVYCDDLQRLIDHVLGRVSVDVRDRLARSGR